MGVIYKQGEVKTRPGAYRMITNRGSWTALDVDPFATKPEEPDTPSEDIEMNVTYNDDTRTVILNVPGAAVASDGAGTVKITGLKAKVSHNGSTVKIGE